MSSRRTLKAAEAIREVVSTAILLEVRDPRVRDVTVTKVDVAPDMKSAKVYVSIMGDERKQRLSLQGLQNSAGFLQKAIADRIDSRYTPRLTFETDDGVKKSLEVLRLLKEVLPPEETSSPGAGESPAAEDRLSDRDESDAADGSDHNGGQPDDADGSDGGTADDPDGRR
ncbi:MAG TPA: 30S ribosome-binding factor RbfA [Pirellulaceae bacterium]|jgi:ribosome-binding factor A|nr:30S ribosome-binding factor RbfA [Pirellulaceae bacterium]